MSRSLIVYFSQGGTTTRVAESIAAGLRAAEWQVDLFNLKDGQPPETRGYDLIGIGTPVYYFRPPFNVLDYVQSLPNLDGQAFFVFMLHGTYRGAGSTTLRRTLARKGGREVGYWHCYGADTFLGYLKRGYLFSPNSPTAEELTQAETFGREVAARCAGQPYTRMEEDRPPAAIFRLEGFLVNRWLVRQLYSRLFTVDAEKCTACDLCIEECPTGNITKDGKAQLVWDRDCLLCLTCEMNCPEEAISSPLDWPVFKPFLAYNVRHHLHDADLEYVPVTHKEGQTQRV